MSFNPQYLGFRQTSGEAGGAPDYMAAMKRGLEMAQTSAKTLNTPRQLSEQYLKDVLANQHSKTINKYLDRSEQARIGGMELSNTGKSLENQYAPQNQSDKVRAALDIHLAAQDKSKLDRFKAKYPFLSMSSKGAQLAGLVQWASDPENAQEAERMNAALGAQTEGPSGRELPQDEQSTPQETPQTLQDKLQNSEGSELNRDRFYQAPGQPMNFEMEGGQQQQGINPQAAQQSPKNINMEGGASKQQRAQEANPLMKMLSDQFRAGMQPKAAALSIIGKMESEREQARRDGDMRKVHDYDKAIEKAGHIATPGANKLPPYEQLVLDVQKAQQVAQVKENVKTVTEAEKDMPQAEAMLGKIDQALEAMAKHKDWFGPGTLGFKGLGGSTQRKRGVNSPDYADIETTLGQLVGPQARELQGGNKITNFALGMAEKIKPSMDENYEIAYRKLSNIRDGLAKSISEENGRYKAAGGNANLVRYKGFEPRSINGFKNEADYDKYMQSLSPHQRDVAAQQYNMKIKLKGEK